MYRLILIIIISVIYNIPASGQVWPKFFGELTNSKLSRRIHESYDLGYLLTGHIAVGNTFRKGFILKMDINGEMLWEKVIGEGQYINPATSSIPTNDGGMVVVGFTKIFDSNGDAYVLKLNACYEQEWFTVLYQPDTHSASWDVLELPGGNLIVLINFYGYNLVDERIWLFCLSSSGEILWEQLYAQNPDKPYFDEFGKYLMLSDEYHILITAETERLLGPGHYTPSTLHIYVDTLGNELWARPYYFFDSSFISMPYRTIQDEHGIFYTCGRAGGMGLSHAVSGMMTFDRQGDEIEWITVYPPYPHNQATIHNMIIYDTNHWVLTGSYFNHGMDRSRIILYKTDTLGNILKDKEIFEGSNPIRDATLTSDDYVIMTSYYLINNPPYYYITHVNKVDGELNEAEFDPRQLTYDSLCPYPIVSDTIIPDTGYYVGHRPVRFSDTVQKASIKVYPNPANTLVNLRLPESVSQNGYNGFFHRTTVYHRWIVDAHLQVFNIHGQMIYTQKIPDGQQELSLDVSNWPPGLYLLKVTARNGIVVDGKLLVE